MTPTYTADLKRTWLGWEFTVWRVDYVSQITGDVDRTCVGQTPPWAAVFYRTRASALNAATKRAQHEKASHSVQLPI